MLNELLNNIGTGESNANPGATPMTVNTIQTNTFDVDEDNMTDSFKQFSIE